MLRVIKYVVYHQWGLILIALLSVINYFIPKLPTYWIAIISIFIILINQAIELRRTQYQTTIKHASRLKNLVYNFQNRFINTGSAYSIFYLIRELGKSNTDRKAEFEEWARGCLLGMDFLEKWIQSLNERLYDMIEKRTKQDKSLSERYDEYVRMNRLYYRLVEEFYNRINSREMPEYILSYYNDFVLEYNAYIYDLRNAIGEMRGIRNLNFDVADIRLAKNI